MKKTITLIKEIIHMEENTENKKLFRLVKIVLLSHSLIMINFACVTNKSIKESEFIGNKYKVLMNLKDSNAVVGLFSIKKIESKANYFIKKDEIIFENNFYDSLNITEINYKNNDSLKKEEIFLSIIHNNLN